MIEKRSSKTALHESGSRTSILMPLYGRSLARGEAFVNYSCTRHLAVHSISNG